MINVIIPYYNSENTIDYTLSSLISQTSKNFKVIIIDDGSKIPAKDTIKKYNDFLPINLITFEENLGVAAARQAGLESVIEKEEEYILFLDSDDMLYPRAIEVLEEKIKSEECEMVVSQLAQELDDHEIKIKDINENQSWLHGKLYSIGFLKNEDIRFFTSLRSGGEDTVFNLLALNLAIKIGKVKEVTCLWRNNKNSLTRNYKSEFYKGCYTNMTIALILAYRKFLILGKNKSTFEYMMSLYTNYELSIVEKNENLDKLNDELFEFLNSELLINNFKKTMDGRDIKYLTTHAFWCEKGIIYRHTFTQWLKLFNANGILEILENNNIII